MSVTPGRAVRGSGAGQTEGRRQPGDDCDGKQQHCSSGSAAALFLSGRQKKCNGKWGRGGTANGNDATTEERRGMMETRSGVGGAAQAIGGHNSAR